MQEGNSLGSCICRQRQGKQGARLRQGDQKRAAGLGRGKGEDRAWLQGQWGGRVRGTVPSVAAEAVRYRGSKEDLRSCMLSLSLCTCLAYGSPGLSLHIQYLPDHPTGLVLIPHLLFLSHTAHYPAFRV